MRWVGADEQEKKKLKKKLRSIRKKPYCPWGRSDFSIKETLGRRVTRQHQGNEWGLFGGITCCPVLFSRIFPPPLPAHSVCSSSIIRLWPAKSEIGVNNRRRGWNEDAAKKKTQSFHADQCAEFGGGNGTLSWVGAVICVRRRGGCPDMLPEPRLS